MTSESTPSPALLSIVYSFHYKLETKLNERLYYMIQEATLRKQRGLIFLPCGGGKPLDILGVLCDNRIKIRLSVSSFPYRNRRLLLPDWFYLYSGVRTSEHCINYEYR